MMTTDERELLIALVDLVAELGDAHRGMVDEVLDIAERVMRTAKLAEDAVA